MTSPPARSRSLLARIFLSPAEKRLRAGWRLLLHSLLLISCLLVLVPYGLLEGLSQPMGQLAWQFGIALAVTLSVYLARRWFDRRSFVSLGLRWDARAAGDLIFGILLSGGMMALIFAGEYLLGWLHFEGFAWQTTPLAEVLEMMLTAMGVFFLVGWSEELLDRGYYLQNLSDGLTFAAGALLSSLIFAAAHLANPNFSWAALAGLFISGLFFVFSYWRTRQLWLPIGLHIGWNFFEGTVFGFPVSGMSFPSLIGQNVHGPELITGGAFGPEAGLIVMPALALGAVLIHWYTRAHFQASRNG